MRKAPSFLDTVTIALFIAATVLAVHLGWPAFQQYRAMDPNKPIGPETIDTRGPVVLVFFDMNCQVCETEAPTWASYDRASTIFVAYNENPEGQIAWAESRGLSPVYIADTDDDFGLATPAYILYDEEGRRVRQVIGGSIHRLDLSLGDDA